MAVTPRLSATPQWKQAPLTLHWRFLGKIQLVLVIEGWGKRPPRKRGEALQTGVSGTIRVGIYGGAEGTRVELEGRKFETADFKAAQKFSFFFLEEQEPARNLVILFYSGKHRG